MPSLYELDSEPEDNLIGEDNASETSETLLGESVSFIRPQDRPQKKRPMVSRTAGLVTLLIVLVVFTIATASSIRKRHRKLPVSGNPIIEHLQPEYFHKYNSERVRIKYGPFEVPSSHVDNGMKNFIEQNATMPCKDCLITWFQADLIYEDGTTANADTGMWLHHTVLTNSGGEDAKGCNYRGERFFASGNERTLIDISMAGTEKSGYYISNSDVVWMMTELMNEHSSSRTAVLSITYEYIPYYPDDFQSVTSIWLDIGGCRASEVEVPADETSFHFYSPSWTSTVSGRILFAMGHLHDGGTHLDVRKGKESVCRSVPKYDEHDMNQRAGKDLETRHGFGMDMSHITEMTVCHEMGRIEVGEEWTVRADYDIAAHPPMLDSNGEAEAVMGIAVMYVVEK